MSERIVVKYYSYGCYLTNMIRLRRAGSRSSARAAAERLAAKLYQGEPYTLVEDPACRGEVFLLERAAGPEPAADIESRIFAALAGHSGQKPACVEDVIAVVGGDEKATWTVLEQLVKSCQVATAHIQRKGDAVPWLALWPTGVVRRVGGWSSGSLSTLFTPCLTQREIVKAACEPKVQPPRRARARKAAASGAAR